MGFITSTLSTLSKVTLFLLLIAVLPGIPPHTEFEVYSISPAVPLEGTLSLNSLLNNAEHYLEGQIHGPEDLQVHNGHLYTGLHGGQVVRIVKDKVESVVKFGQQCDGFHEEEICGRPLGLTFDKNGKMYVADAYYGIFKVDPVTGTSEQLVSSNDTINGKQAMVFNAVDVGSDGSVYWTDSSSSHALHNGLFICLANGNGRLLKYDPSTKRSSILLDKLFFANGVALSDDNSFLLVCETVKHRILKYYLKGVKAGESEVFVDGLPGMPDNIHSDKSGGFVVTLVEPRDAEHLSVVAALAPYPLVRKLLARLLYLVQRTVIFAQDLYPNDFLKKAAHLIGHFESLPPPMLKRAAVLFLTREGKVKRSLYATDGLTGISAFAELGGYYYLGSPYNTFLARVKAS